MTGRRSELQLLQVIYAAFGKSLPISRIVVLGDEMIGANGPEQRGKCRPNR
jgi:hypothetical protein